MRADHLIAWYHPWAVALSIVIAMLGAYAALDLAERVTAARDSARVAWMFGGGTAAAIGIWSMHYTGMLALHLPVPILYDWPTALLAFACALVASLIALVVVTRRHMGWRALLAGGGSMGTGISGLHYTAMASMRAPVMHHYSVPLVALSIVLAVVFSLLSLQLMLFFRGGPSGRRRRRVASIFLLGAAICVMHYTGMAAVRFTAGPAPDLSHGVAVSSIGTTAIAGITVTVLLAVIVTSIFDRLNHNRLLLQASAGQLRALSASVTAMQEQQGRRIARELHDELGAALTSLKWDLETIATTVPPALDDPRGDALRDKLLGMTRLIESTTGVVKRIAADLRPSILDDLGLHEAIEWQAGEFRKRTGISVQCDCDIGQARLSTEQSTAVFRILQEALTNVLRHADASRVDIEAHVEQSALALCVRDNGRGISEEERAARRSLGILGMNERAALIGATLDILGRPGHGTEVRLRVPLTKTAMVNR